MLKKLTDQLIEQTLEKARKSDRKRYLHCIHDQGDSMQRMINALTKDTYVRPHKHENPDKLEIFCILKGKACVIVFEDNGNILEKVIIDQAGDNKSVEIPPRTWHTIFPLSQEAAVYELIEGRYDESTHKKFAQWSPEEGSEEALSYLHKLKEKV